MSTLTELFDQYRDQLRQRISTDTNPEKVIREVKDCVSSLLIAYGKDKERSLVERRLSGFMLDLLNASVSTLAAFETGTSYSEQTPTSHISFIPADNSKLLWRAMQIVIIVALLGSLLQARAFTPIILLLVVVAVEARAWFLLDSQPTTSVQTVRTVSFNVDTFLAKLRDAIRTADTVLADVVKPASPSVSPLESDSALLDLFQEFLHALYSADGIFALKQMKVLPVLLEQHGIKIEDLKGDNEHLFDFVPNLDSSAQTRLTLKPALLKRGGQLLKRGLAAEP